MSANDRLILVSTCLLASLLLCVPAPAQTATQPAAQTQAVDAPASQAFPLLKGPYLQAMRPDGVTICLEPLQESDGRIVVQTAGGKTVAEKAFQATPGKITRVEITGLKANESYPYAVYLASEARPAFASTFKTFPPVGSLPVEFAATGDSRTYPDIWHNICEGIRKLGVPMVLHTGDFVTTGRVVSMWDDQFFAPGREMLASTALYPAVGNHELGGVGPGAYSVLDQFFVLPEDRSWYGFDYGGVHFTVLDSSRPEKLEGEQYAWAEADLAASKAPWKVAVFHHPWFCAGNHESDTEMRRIYGPLFVRTGVDLILVGHDHNYQKTKPIVQAFAPKSAKPYWQIVTGGGGAPLYNKPRPEVFLDKFFNVNHYLKVTAEKDRMVAVAYNLDGSELDRLEIHKGKPAEGTVTIEQIDLEQAIRDWLVKHPFVLEPGEMVATLGGVWTNTLPVPIDLQFTLGDDKRFELKADSAKVRVPRSAASQPSTTDIRLKLQLLASREGLREMPTALNVSYQGPQVGSGKLGNIRVPIAVIKALQPASAGEIKLDGQLDEPFWSQGQPLTGLRDIKKQDAEPAGIATTVRAATDRETLYLGIRCKLPNGWVEDDSADLSKADHVRIDLAGAQGKKVALTVTPSGKTQIEPADGTAKVAITKAEGGWTLEVALPLGQLGETREIHFNVRRQTGRVVYSLASLFGGEFDYDTAAILTMKAPATQPAAQR